jgi:hypothetical protein
VKLSRERFKRGQVNLFNATCKIVKASSEGFYFGPNVYRRFDAGAEQRDQDLFPNRQGVDVMGGYGGEEVRREPDIPRGFVKEGDQEIQVPR